MKIRVLSELRADVPPINSITGGVGVAQGEQRFHLNSLAKDFCA